MSSGWISEQSLLEMHLVVVDTVDETFRFFSARTSGKALTDMLYN